MQVKKITKRAFFNISDKHWKKTTVKNTNLPIQAYFIISRRGKENTPSRQEWLAPKLETLLHYLWPFFCINISFPLAACSFLLNRRHLHAGKLSLCQHKSSPCIILQTSHQFYSFLNAWKTKQGQKKGAIDKRTKRSNEWKSILYINGFPVQNICWAV